MVIFAFLLPLLVIITVLYLQRHNGKKELLKLDLVQFTYSFILLPIVFVWLKSFLFLLLQNDAELKLSIGQIFLIDTVYSLLFLFIFAFVVMHSITKTFSLKYKRDPLYDILEHSEYYHLWLSHVASYVGVMVLVTVISIVNLFLPMNFLVPKARFLGMLLFAVVAGLLAFLGVWTTDTGYKQFWRLMKLAFGVQLLVMVFAYFLVEPAFSFVFGFYWFVFVASLTTVVLSFLFERSNKAMSVFERFEHWFVTTPIGSKARRRLK